MQGRSSPPPSSHESGFDDPSSSSCGSLVERRRHGFVVASREALNVHLAFVKLPGSCDVCYISSHKRMCSVSSFSFAHHHFGVHACSYFQTREEEEKETKLMEGLWGRGTLSSMPPTVSDLQVNREAFKNNAPCFRTSRCRAHTPVRVYHLGKGERKIHDSPPSGGSERFKKN